MFNKEKRIYEFSEGEICFWNEQGSSIHIKAITKGFNDPVEIGAEEAKEIAASLLTLAKEIEATEQHLMSFEIKNFSITESRTFVFAERIGTAPFNIREGSKLGGLLVDRWKDEPQRDPVKAQEHPNIFAFVLRDPLGYKKLKKGDIVVFEE